MKTKAELRKVILSSMTVIDPEETPSAEQAKTLDLYVDSARGILRERGLCWWDEDAIPDEVLIPFSNYVQSWCCGAFGRAGKFEGLRAGAVMELSAMKPPAAHETTRTDYF